jgi:hypothetical protein
VICICGASLMCRLSIVKLLQLRKVTAYILYIHNIKKDKNILKRNQEINKRKGKRLTVDLCVQGCKRIEERNNTSWFFFFFF